ncbi:hypothetical protein [Pontivivens ytuae]|uniref:Uncharacterized protein n=1 Tax=Pontivivens ytuae TaxID=2789856 RepID=A0A7S9LQ94_9RHOB|nr:hypothetical protein [Pontivivens ytuae]QPH53294.1 hypothetical protein I0K15_16090 [Pontivivens ytuae]
MIAVAATLTSCNWTENHWAAEKAFEGLEPVIEAIDAEVVRTGVAPRMLCDLPHDSAPVLERTCAPDGPALWAALTGMRQGSAGYLANARDWHGPDGPDTYMIRIDWVGGIKNTCTWYGGAEAWDCFGVW